MLTTKQRDDWADALESGQYKQAYRTIYSPGQWHADLFDRFCCLGVLQCTLGNREEVMRSRPYPNAVLENREQVQFMVFNDTEELTFPEIAVHVRALPVSDGPNLDER